MLLFCGSSSLSELLCWNFHGEIEKFDKNMFQQSAVSALTIQICTMYGLSYYNLIRRENFKIRFEIFELFFLICLFFPYLSLIET